MNLFTVIVLPLKKKKKKKHAHPWKKFAFKISINPSMILCQISIPKKKLAFFTGSVSSDKACNFKLVIYKCYFSLLFSFFVLRRHLFILSSHACNVFNFFIKMRSDIVRKDISLTARYIIA